MTDQGPGYHPYGETGAGGEPQYPTQPPQYPTQPPQYPTQPPPPQYPPQNPPQYPTQPGYGPPPPNPTQQFPPVPPQQPPDPRYPAQPGYGQPQQPPYPGQPGYGTPPPGYPPQGYGAPGGPTGPGGPGGVGATGGGNRKGLLAAAAAALVVAAAVVAYFIFSGGSASASSPKDAVKKLLDAGKKNDINAAKKVLCKGDLALGEATKLGSSGRILSYTIGKSSTKNGITTITVTASTTQNPTPSSAEFPVVKEGGAWKVCFTKALSNLPTGPATGLPSLPTGSSSDALPSDSGFPSSGGLPSGSGFPTSLPTSLPAGLNICSSSNDAQSAADAYIGAAEAGLTQFAQSCVYHNIVPLSVTTSLNGKLYAPDSNKSSADQFVFNSIDGSTTVTIKVTKESDGHYYITGVQKS